MYQMTVKNDAIKHGMPGPLKPVLISKTTGKKYPNTKEGRDQLDRDEGREKLYNDQLEALIVSMGAYRVLRRAMPMLKAFGQKTGTGRMLSASVGLIGGVLNSLCSKVKTSQWQMIEHNTKDVCITISASKVDGMVNIPSDYLLPIVDRALEACEMYCTARCEDSKGCALREAFEHVPALGGLQRGAGTDGCPYRGVRVEV